jgi:CheY-like chemotaxis protein
MNDINHTTILFVDDDSSMRMLGAVALRSLSNTTVLTAGSGREALELVRESLPDLILLDLTMPRMSGPETLAALQAELGPNCRGVRVVLMTGHDPKSVSELLREDCVVGTIHKPFTPNELRDEVTGYLPPAIGASNGNGNGW